VPAAPPIFGSTGSTTLVLAALLVVLGIAMICTAVWLVRATRTDVPALGPLEVMGDRRFRRRDAEARQRALAAARPLGALPPAPMLEPDDVVAELPAAPATAAPEPAASVADPAPDPRPEPEPAVDDVEEPQPAEST
jgi:hypothetical protein